MCNADLIELLVLSLLLFLGFIKSVNLVTLQKPPDIQVFEKLLKQTTETKSKH